MKWVVLVVATILVIVLLVTVVGMMLPQSHVASVTAHYDAQPVAVWSLITSRERFPEWRSDLQGVQMLGDVDGKQRWKEQTKHDAVTMEITEAVAGQRLVTRIADENLPFGGGFFWHVAHAGIAQPFDRSLPANAAGTRHRFDRRAVAHAGGRGRSRELSPGDLAPDRWI